MLSNRGDYFQINEIFSLHDLNGNTLAQDS